MAFQTIPILNMFHMRIINVVVSPALSFIDTHCKYAQSTALPYNGIKIYWIVFAKSIWMLRRTLVNFFYDYFSFNLHAFTLIAHNFYATYVLFHLRIFSRFNLIYVCLNKKELCINSPSFGNYIKFNNKIFDFIWKLWKLKMAFTWSPYEIGSTIKCICR